MFLCLLPSGAFRSQMHVCEVEFGNISSHFVSVEAIQYP